MKVATSGQMEEKLFHEVGKMENIQSLKERMEEECGNKLSLLERVYRVVLSWLNQLKRMSDERIKWSRGRWFEKSWSD